MYQYWGKSGQYMPRSGAPLHAQEVASAFFKGKERQRKNAATDGHTYFLHGNAIAKHVPEQDIPDAVARKLRGDSTVSIELQVSWAGWCTPTTQRHLEAVGIDAYCGRKDHPATLNGRAVDSTGWYTLSELDAMPRYEHPQPKRRAWRTSLQYSSYATL